ncbi:helix-turn-helix domain-containing protein [Streptomyces sp. BH105]|uniref:helix-turn-helix domain-containing protein n=1 Tax=Streptomyces sp. BH105 TaxID=3410408 RepID=UPI003CF636EB
MTRLLTIDDVAAHLNVPKSWIYDNHKREGIPFKKIGQKLRCRPNDLDRWIDQQRGGAVTDREFDNAYLFGAEGMRREIVKLLREVGYLEASDWVEDADIDI